MNSNISKTSIAKGKVLAEQHCQSCHQLPTPDLLDAKTWETGALTAMGPMMGVFKHKNQTYPYRGDPQLRGPGYLAGHPMVSPEEWQNIVDYYTATAPSQLPSQERKEKIATTLPLFQSLTPKLHYKNAHSCFVQIREGNKAAVVVSDAVTLKTYFLDKHLEPLDSLETDGPLVNIDFDDNHKGIACNVGKIEPNDNALGSAIPVSWQSGKWQTANTPLFKALRRPTQILQTDLNHDGKEDYLVCEFGHMQGGLIWMENLGEGQFQKHLIDELAGALKAQLIDYNQDGKMDIVSLFAQGTEGVFLYLNEGEGNFEKTALLQFPTTYGSSSFEMVDFNQDNLPDILYTAGDNADYTNILKPYHGVYIFLNQGKKHFEQSFFYPINGCYKAMARDFDKDGDLDLTTIAHYADFATQPEEGFIYFENTGNLQFSPHASPETQQGRWITMDVGDIDQDGWPDIVLGNFVQPSKFANPSVNWAEGPPLMVLKNRGR